MEKDCIMASRTFPDSSLIAGRMRCLEAAPGKFSASDEVCHVNRTHGETAERSLALAKKPPEAAWSGDRGRENEKECIGPNESAENLKAMRSGGDREGKKHGMVNRILDP